MSISNFLSNLFFIIYIVLAIYISLYLCKSVSKENFSLFDENIEYTFIDDIKKNSTKIYKAGTVPPPKNELDFFYENKFLGECCYNVNLYSSSSGCACLSSEQKKYFKERGGNNK